MLVYFLSYKNNINIRLRKEIVMALIDIHTHILYGVDDGAKDINDSMGLLDEEREQGVDQVILTPHYGPKFGHPDTEVLREKFEAIREGIQVLSRDSAIPWERIILSARDSFRSETRESIDDEWDPLCFSGVCDIRCLFAYISRGSGFCICRIYSDPCACRAIQSSFRTCRQDCRTGRNRCIYSDKCGKPDRRNF